MNGFYRSHVIGLINIRYGIQTSQIKVGIFRGFTRIQHIHKAPTISPVLRNPKFYVILVLSTMRVFSDLQVIFDFIDKIMALFFGHFKSLEKNDFGLWIKYTAVQSR